MQKHEHYEELCALAALGQLSEEEYETLSTHVESCGSCRDSVEKFSLVLKHLPDEQVETSDEHITELHEASYRDRFLSKAEREGFHFSENVRLRRTQAHPWNALNGWIHTKIPLWIPASTAAALLLVSVFALRSRVAPAPNFAARTPALNDFNVASTSATARSQAHAVRPEDTAKAAAVETAALQSRIFALEAALQSYKSKDQQLDAQLSATNAQLASAKKESFDKQASLEQMTSELSQLKTDLEKLGNNHALDVASSIEQQAKINDLSEQLAQQRQAVQQEQQLSAAAGEVRQMMGARNLHI